MNILANQKSTLGLDRACLLREEEPKEMKLLLHLRAALAFILSLATGTSMRRIALYVAIFAGAASAAPPSPGDPVMTIQGLCPGSDAVSVQPAACAVSVSRQQFETLMGILVPNTPNTRGMKEKFAKAYVELLALESGAKELGIDMSPEYLATMRWLRAKTLADLFRHRLEQESAATEKEIEAYYRENASDFEEARLHRLVLPKNNFLSVDREKFVEVAKRVMAEVG